jgi:pyruvate/2-oxoglutarate dehydrogenase complex dihydrolipoamide acyltransferase (E2) component
MAQRIDMPSLGQTTDELVIVEWLKKEGDPVALGESLFSVQTDKAQVEVESVAAGTLLKVLRDAGETVRSGSPVAYVGALGDAVPASPDGVEDGGDFAGVPTTAAAATEGQAPIAAPIAEAARLSPVKALGTISALPAARRLANELGVDLNIIGGTGQDGVITVRDVELAAQETSDVADGDGGEAT